MSVQVIFDQAQIAHQAGDLEEAEHKYRQCLDLEPKHLDALHYLGVVLGQRQEHEKALVCLKQAAELAPALEAVHLNLAQVLQRKGHILEAMSYLKRILTVVLPGSLALYLRWGQLCYIQGLYAEALAVYQRALVYHPAEPALYFKRAQIYLELHHFKAAQMALNWVLLLAPDHEPARAQLNAIYSLPETYTGLPKLHLPEVSSDASLPERYLTLLKSQLLDLAAPARGEANHLQLVTHIVWPLRASTMIGPARMDHLQRLLEYILDAHIPGDVIETGVWRGGATVFMRGFLKAHGIIDRRVWVADSFEGLPPPNSALYPQDAGGLILHQERPIQVSFEVVKTHFERYGLLDSQVVFLKGFFKDTLPSAPIKKLALMRLDGDMYESTLDALTHLYPKLASGGVVIVDDYGAIPACREAVHDFFKMQQIDPDVQWVDSACVSWIKTS